MILKRFYEEGLAQASYLIGCSATGEGLVVDPNRELDLYIAAAAAEDLRITHVTETHIHADFASGSRELARLAGARLFLSAEGGADWQYPFAAQDGAVLLRDGDRFRVGNIEIQAVHTPGHTPEHLSFLVTDTPATDKPVGIFTGDFVFAGDVGRPDLLERAAGVTGSMEEGARQLFRSLQRFKRLPDHLQIWPGHGAGSACGKSLGGVPQSTVGYERIASWAFQIEEESEFIRAVLSDQPEPPFYFAEMKRINRAGYRVSRLEPRDLSELEVLEALRMGEMVVDVRPAESFAAAHLPGTINIPLSRKFATWAGWLIPYDQPFTLIAPDEAARAEAERNLRLIALERNAQFHIGTPAAPTCESYRRLDPEEARRDLANGARAVLLDVRNQSERDAERIPDSIHIPLGYLPLRLCELPKNRPIIVTCQAGNRSPIAASILQARGFADIAELSGGLDAWTGEKAEHPTE